MVLLVVLKGEKVYKVPIIERQSNPLPFLAYTHPQPP
nr:MAG TPA: hypothetical protein [Bacteriophage sp.]